MFINGEMLRGGEEVVFGEDKERMGGVMKVEGGEGKMGILLDKM